jgi:lycopene cyclase domain-containing protein
MTYARLLAVLLLPLLAWGALRARPLLERRHLLLLAALSAVVLVWTSPWDNAAVAMGLWGFDRERTSGIFLGRLPIEEYAFFLLQTWIVSLFVIRRLMRPSRARRDRAMRRRPGLPA